MAQMTNPFATPTAQAPVVGNPFAAPTAQTAVPTPQTGVPTAQTAAGVGAYVDAFGDPAARLPKAPRMRDLYGRLLLIIPSKLETGIESTVNPGKFQDRMTADVIVLDGGTIHYGGKPEAVPAVAHMLTAEVPLCSRGQWLSFSGIISQCREALAKRAQGQPGMVLGRLSAGVASKPGSNPPWLLTPPSEADKAIARAYLASVDPFA